tara:strand:+ start:696 stop:818 length:123 start_codon:yes stop_codon:yes gene_type:complete
MNWNNLIGGYENTDNFWIEEEAKIKKLLKLSQNTLNHLSI